MQTLQIHQKRKSRTIVHPTVTVAKRARAEIKAAPVCAFTCFNS